jgi:hypothetical protein
MPGPVVVPGRYAGTDGSFAAASGALYDDPAAGLLLLPPPLSPAGGLSRRWAAAAGNGTIYNSAEAATQGTGVTAGNSGGVSGTPADLVTTSATCSLTGDAGSAAHGYFGYLVTLGGTAGEAYFQWLAALSPADQQYMYARAYFKFAANPGGALNVIRFATAAGTTCGSCQVTTAGKLAATDSAGTAQATSTGSIPLGRPFRADLTVFGSAAAGQVTIHRYDTMDAAAATETVSTAATLNTGGPGSRLRFGHTGAGVANVTFSMDDLAASVSDLPGPAVYPFTGWGAPM